MKGGLFMNLVLRITTDGIIVYCLTPRKKSSIKKRFTITDYFTIFTTFKEIYISHTKGEYFLDRLTLDIEYRDLSYMT